MYVFTWRHSTCPRYFASIFILFFSLSVFLHLPICKMVFDFECKPNVQRRTTFICCARMRTAFLDREKKKKKKNIDNDVYIKWKRTIVGFFTFAVAASQIDSSAKFSCNGVGWVTLIKPLTSKTPSFEYRAHDIGLWHRILEFVWRKIVITRVFFFQIGKIQI